MCYDDHGEPLPCSSGRQPGQRFASQVEIIEASLGVRQQPLVLAWAERADLCRERITAGRSARSSLDANAKYESCRKTLAGGLASGPRMSGGRALVPSPRRESIRLGSRSCERWRNAPERNDRWRNASERNDRGHPRLQKLPSDPVHRRACVVLHVVGVFPRVDRLASHQMRGFAGPRPAAPRRAGSMHTVRCYGSSIRSPPAASDRGSADRPVTSSMTATTGARSASTLATRLASTNGFIASQLHEIAAARRLHASSTTDSRPATVCWTAWASTLKSSSRSRRRTTEADRDACHRTRPPLEARHPALAFMKWNR